MTFVFTPPDVYGNPLRLPCEVVDGPCLPGYTLIRVPAWGESSAAFMANSAFLEAEDEGAKP